MAPQRKHGHRVDGVLLLDKPLGISSSAALQRARRLLEAERAGHTGTLDPLASGLLVLCFGEATKFSGELLDAGKSYIARLKLGESTTTGDVEGEIVSRRPASVALDRLHHSLADFRGEIAQIPPMYSALKRDGRPLYEYARKGIQIERSARRVTISSLEVIALEGAEATLAVSCSKGTYVRTLAQDIGEALGCGAHLIGLMRTAVGPFRLEQALRLEDLEASALEERTRLLLPVDSLVRDVPAQQLGESDAAAFVHGRVVWPVRALAGRLRVYGKAGRFLGLGFGDDQGKLHPKRLVTGT